MDTIENSPLCKADARITLGGADGFPVVVKAAACSDIRFFILRVTTNVKN